MRFMGLGIRLGRLLGGGGIKIGMNFDHVLRHTRCRSLISLDALHRYHDAATCPHLVICAGTFHPAPFTSTVTLRRCEAGKFIAFVRIFARISSHRTINP